MLKRLAIILSLSTALTAFGGTGAQAMPAAIGAVAAFAGTPIGAIVTNLVIGQVASWGSSLLKNLFGGAQQPKPASGVRLTVGAGGVVPQAFIMGDWATAGSLAYRGSWGNNSTTPNAFYVEERVLSDIPMPELTGFWIGELKGTILWDDADEDKGFPIAQKRRGGVDHLWVKYRDGTQTDADPYLRDKFGDHATRPYDEEMIGRGQAVAIVTRRLPKEDDRDLFAGNIDYKFETSGIALYNIAKDSTAGGSGDHRRDDPDTWEPSNNPVVQAHNIFCGIYYGDEWVFGLQGLHPSRTPASSWIAAINACDEATPKADANTEPAYETGIEISADMEPAGVVEELFNGCAGRIAEIGGIYKVLVGMPGAAVFSYTDADIIVSRDQQFEPFPRIEGVFNGLRAKHPSPAAGWELKDAPARYSAELEAIDGGRRVADVTYAAVTSSTQVQRLMKAAGEEQRRWRRHREVLPPISSELEPLDVVAKSSARNGYDEKAFLITDIEDEPTYLGVFSLQELDPADYDWNAATEEQATAVGSLTPTVPPAQVIIGWAVEPATLPDDEGNIRRPAVKFTWNGAVEDVRSVAFQLRTVPDEVLVFDDSTENVIAGEATIASARILSAQNLEGRGKYHPRGPRLTDWTEWLPVTTPDVAELPPGSVNNVMLNKALKDAINFVVGTGPGTIADLQERIAEELDRLGASVVTSTMASDRDRKVVSASVGEVQAAVVAETLARVNADTALGQFILEVAAQAASGLAEGLFTVQAVSGPEGASVTLALLARVTNLETYVETGILIALFPDGVGGYDSKIIFKAESIFFTDGANTTQPMVFEDGVLTLNVANIGTVTAGLLRNASGSSFLRLSDGALRLSRTVP